MLTKMTVFLKASSISFDSLRNRTNFKELIKLYKNTIFVETNDENLNLNKIWNSGFKNSAKPQIWRKKTLYKFKDEPTLT